MAVVTYLEAIRQGLWEEMERDASVFVMGEDVGVYGGAFKVTEGFIHRFGQLEKLLKALLLSLISLLPSPVQVAQ